MRPRVSCASRIKEGMKMRGMKQVDLRGKTGIPKSEPCRFLTFHIYSNCVISVYITGFKPF